VRDNGAGIEPQLLDKVFELFVQGERALDRGQGGLGIGLTLVKRLVELHQGRVQAASDGPGKGATFTVALPCISAVDAQPRAAHPAPVTADSRVYGRRVLVVDDNIDSAESTAAFLGWRPRGQGGARRLRALASLKVFDPHVVVLDIGLPASTATRSRGSCAAAMRTRAGRCCSSRPTGYSGPKAETSERAAGSGEIRLRTPSSRAASRPRARSGATSARPQPRCRRGFGRGAPHRQRRLMTIAEMPARSFRSWTQAV
jgi:two-component system CheB/CheR fusion protein